MYNLKISFRNFIFLFILKSVRCDAKICYVSTLKNKTVLFKLTQTIYPQLHLFTENTGFHNNPVLLNCLFRDHHKRDSIYMVH